MTAKLAGEIAGLDQLTVCGWDTTSLERDAISRIDREVSKEHPSAAVLRSCQRIEGYQIGTCACPAPGRWVGPAVLRHLAEVAAGLHSVVLGEEQILGQSRRTFDSSPIELQSLTGIAIAAARELAEATGKAVSMVKDAPETYGFLLNRIFAAARREADTIRDAGIASEEDIDKAMITGRNWPAAFYGHRGGIGKQW